MLRRLFKKSKTLIILWSLLSDSRARVKQMMGRFSSHSGDTHSHMTLKESLGYIESVYADYLKVGGLTENDLSGKSIWEIGPGDNFGVALKFLAAGAGRVACLDRFYSNRSFDQQSAIYGELFKEFPPAVRDRLTGVLRVSPESRSMELDRERLRSDFGVGVEDAVEKYGDAGFDLIVSRSVLEHVSDVERAFDSMDRLLKPGGLMVHKIDFRDHGMFTEGGHHPLTFLTLPEWLYRRMSEYSGRPNRKLINTYRRLAETYGYDAQFLVNHDIPLERVEEIRPRLAKGYRDLPAKELAVTGVFLRARKKADGKQN